MSPRRSAFFDIGTNTILCLIAEIRDTGRFRVLDDLAEIVGLGQGVDQTRLISPEAARRALHVLQRFVHRCRSLGVEEMTAVGTSALRDAENSEQVRSSFRDEIGLDVRVLSGAEEAAYSCLAVQRGLPLANRELLVIDIGGGSTEFIRGNDAGVSAAISIDMGSVRLTERFLHSDPIAPAEAHTMISAIDRELAALPGHGIEAGSGVALVGIAATFTTLAAMEKRLVTYSHPAIHGSRITARQVRAQVSAVQMKTIAERKGIIGLDPKRAEVIFAGACLIDRILSFYGKDEVVVSDQGVRYGLLHEAAEAMQKG